jgi:uncharacterized protein
VNAAALMLDSQPRTPALHLFRSDAGDHLFLADGSRLYDIDALTREAIVGSAEAIHGILAHLGLEPERSRAMEPVQDPPIRSLSLAVSQACNLACGYCYAQGGSFGAPERHMSWAVAEKAVRLLFSGASAGDRVVIAFLGGEPLINRDLIRRVTDLADGLAQRNSVRAGFSITTNGTLLRPDDGEFFERHGFAVTISMDGPSEQHDQLRIFADGRPSYRRIVEKVAPLLRMQQRMQVTARVTITPSNLNLAESLDHLLGRGFHSVGFAPMLASPNGQHQMDENHFGIMLEQMMQCGDEFLDRTIAGERYAFSNLTEALRQLHRGTHRPYPCGAGASYLGVSASGDLSACHRFVEDRQGAMGHVDAGVDRDRQNQWLRERHVDRQEPCRSCWARYLCGGGCHHEVLNRGRVACDYVRGWLQYCLLAYVRLQREAPAYFGPYV